MSNILQTIGQGIQKLGDADVQNRLQAFGATMRNDIQGAAALNSEYAARAQRNKELEQARKERLEQERTRKLERGEDRKWSVADMLAAQEYQANQAQVGRDFQASQQEDQQQHAVDIYGIQRKDARADLDYMTPVQKAKLAGDAQAHVREIDDENIKREAMGLEPLPYNNQLLDLAGLSPVTKAIATVESGGRHTNSDGSLVTSPAGAMGIMQIMPSTGKDPGYGVTPAKDNSMAENIRVGEEYFAALLKKHNGDYTKAIASYNAGPGRVDEEIEKHGDDWLSYMPKETQNYVPNVLSKIQQGQTKTSAPQTSPTRQPLNIKNFTPQQAALYSSKGFIADKDGMLVKKDGYSGEAQDTYGRPIYLNEGKVLKPSEVKALKGIEQAETDKKDKVQADINTLNSSLVSLEDITNEDITNVGGFSAMVPGVSSLPGVKGSASKLQVVMAKEFLANITKMTGQGSLSNAEGAKLMGEFAGMLDNEGNLKMGISESVLKDKIYRTRALIEAVKASKENKVATGKELSPDEIDALYKSKLEQLQAGSAAEKDSNVQKAVEYTKEQQALLDKW